MSQKSAPDYWYDVLDSPEAFERLAEESLQEHPYLEFKGGVQGHDLNKDTRRALAKALSAFANVNGGVLVLGMDARRGSTGAYEEIRSKPCDHAASIHAWIESHLHTMTDPSLPDISIKPILADGTRGYVVVRVPRYDGVPVQALAGENRFYQRVGSTSEVMPHRMIADRFGVRPQPKIHLTYEWIGNQSRVDRAVLTHQSGARFTAGLWLTLQNTSAASLRNAFLKIETTSNWKPIAYRPAMASDLRDRGFDCSRHRDLPDGNSFTLRGVSGSPTIYPTETVFVATWSFEIDINCRDPSVFFDTSVCVYAEEMPPLQHEQRLALPDICDAVRMAIFKSE